ncbi:hypothetical protein MJH12_13405, partial [bacterium]|nr:hypothetical protein [bacterium]
AFKAYTKARILKPDDEKLLQAYFISLEKLFSKNPQLIPRKFELDEMDIFKKKVDIKKLPVNFCERTPFLECYLSLRKQLTKDFQNKRIIHQILILEAHLNKEEWEKLADKNLEKIF